MISDPLSRRRFLLRSAACLAGSALAPSAGMAAGKAPLPRSETLVRQLHGSLNEEQRRRLCFEWNDPRRLKVDNNWHITPHRLRDVLKGDQQDLVRQIFDSLHSDDYKKEVWRQFDQDNKGDGGFASSSMALFGNPGSGQL